jgi:hypothetical protein
MGMAAAAMLIALIEGKPLTRKRVILPAALILRESTPPAHSGRPGKSIPAVDLGPATGLT